MIVLRPSLSTQTITVIPRYDAEVISLTITSEETQEPNNYELSTSYANGYMTVSFELTVREAESFNLEITDGTNVLFRGKAFATDETDLENYKISNGLIQ